MQLFREHKNHSMSIMMLDPVVVYQSILDSGTVSFGGVAYPLHYVVEVLRMIAMS